MVSANNKGNNELKEDKKNRGAGNTHSIIGSNGHLNTVSSSTPAAGEDQEKDGKTLKFIRLFVVPIDPFFIDSQDKLLIFTIFISM